MKILDPDQQYVLPEPESEIDEYLYELGRASANWYRTHDSEYVDLFHDIYHKLRSLGWNGGIDVDVALPDNLMPQEYLDQISDDREKIREKSVLFVTNEDFVVRPMLGRAVEKMGYRLTIANDSLYARELIAEQRPALVVLDLKLPTREVRAFIKTMKKNNIPLIWTEQPLEQISTTPEFVLEVVSKLQQP